MIVVDDENLAELLVETLVDAGHVVRAAPSADVLGGGALGVSFEIALVDLESRAHVGAEVVAKIRRDAPKTKLIALLPCGATTAELPGCDLTIETPAADSRRSSPPSIRHRRRVRLSQPSLIKGVMVAAIVGTLAIAYADLRREQTRALEDFTAQQAERVRGYAEAVRARLDAVRRDLEAAADASTRGDGRDEVLKRLVEWGDGVPGARDQPASRRRRCRRARHGAPACLGLGGIERCTHDPSRRG